MGIPKMADIYSLKFNINTMWTFYNVYRVYDPLSLIKILLFYLAKVETIKGVGSRYSKNNVAPPNASLVNV